MERTLTAEAQAPGGLIGSERRAPVVRLPDGTRLLHIGPHKTGTTALQAALWNARPKLLTHGVRLVGRSRNPSAAVRAAVGQRSPYGETPPRISNWHSLVREFRRAREPRMVVSSEFFAWAGGETIRRIVDEIDRDRVHIAVTLRPLARIIPSMWQQNVQLGMVTPFEEWVDGILAPPGAANRSFWTLERHDELIQRWADVVGADRVTAVVVDDRDHAVLIRTFEALLGVPDGTLVADHDVMNRSLTLPEAEAVRAYNIAFNANGLPRDLHARSMRFGAAQLMKRRIPPADEMRVGLPAWAVERVAATQSEIVRNIETSGIRIVGDLATLTEVGATPLSSGASTPVISPDIAASMAMGILVASGAVRTAAVNRGPFRVAEPVEVARVPTYQLFGSIVIRAWRASIGRLAGRGGSTPDQDA